MNRDEKSVDISNAIRLLLEKDSIEIHFGKRIDEDNVEVVQKVLVSPETALQPVSYTHLDVYKRQVQKSTVLFLYKK